MKNPTDIVRSLIPISKGTFSKTFLSFDFDTSDQYIEKIFSPNPLAFGDNFFTDKVYRNKLLSGLRKSFNSEVELMKKLKHKNIVKIISSRKGEYPSLIMNYEGESLTYLALNAKPSPLDVFLFLDNISSAIKYLHSQEIVHLDISPSNIFFNHSSRAFILGDFGLARRISPNSKNGSSYQQILGNNKSVPPEFIKNKTFQKSSDIWMFGYCLYYLISGGKVQNWNQRLFEALESINYNHKILLQGTAWSDDKFILELLSSTLVAEPQKRANINVITKKIQLYLKGFKYESKCLMVGDSTKKQVLEFNISGILDKLIKYSTTPFKELNIDTIVEYQNVINALLESYPKFRPIEYYIIRHLLMVHFVQGNPEPTEDIKKAFVQRVQNLINIYGSSQANILIYLIFTILNEIDSSIIYRFAFFITNLNQLINEYTSKNGFIVYGRVVIDEFGHKEIELFNALNKTDYSSRLSLIRIKDFSTFAFKDAVEISDIIRLNNRYDIKTKTKTSIMDNEELFMIVPSSVFAPKIYYHRIDSDKRGFGLFTTINDVLNFTQSIDLEFILLRNQYMLSTALKKNIKFEASDEFIHYIQTDVDKTESLFITSNPNIPIYES